MPDKAQGMGLNDVPRGALGHWVVIEGKKIKNYQYVVPSTWNLGPRDAKDKVSPLEEALIGTPIADPKNPWRSCARCILRPVHCLCGSCDRPGFQRGLQNQGIIALHRIRSPFVLRRETGFFFGLVCGHDFFC